MMYSMWLGRKESPSHKFNQIGIMCGSIKYKNRKRPEYVRCNLEFNQMSHFTTNITDALWAGISRQQI